MRFSMLAACLALLALAGTAAAQSPWAASCPGGNCAVAAAPACTTGSCPAPQYAAPAPAYATAAPQYAAPAAWPRAYAAPSRGYAVQAQVRVRAVRRPFAGLFQRRRCP